MKFEKLKEWNQQHNIKGLVKICIICIIVLYLLTNVFNLIKNYISYYNIMIQMDNNDFEKLISKLDEKMDHREENKKEIIGYLILNEYLDEHPELSNISEKEFEHIKTIVKEEMSEKNISIKKIKEKLIQQNNKVSEYYNNSNYNKQTFYGILDIIEIELKYDIYFDNIILNTINNLKEKNGLDTQDLINELNNNNFEIFSKDEEFVKKYGNYYLYQMEYPYALVYLHGSISDLGNATLMIFYSIIIGIIIGFNIYACYNIKKIRNYIIIESVIILLLIFFEHILGGNIFALNFINRNVVNSTILYYLHVPFVNSISNFAFCLSLFFTIAMIIKNRQQIKSLNRINNSK